MYYSKLCSSICHNVITNPLTGEKYGGTDFTNPGKMVELQAVPLIVETVPEGFEATGWSVVQEGDQWKYRPTLTPIPPPPEIIPPTAEQLVEAKRLLRQSRYRQEADPFLMAALGYSVEAEEEVDEAKRAAILVKRNTARKDYLTVKANIRAEVG